MTEVALPPSHHQMKSRETLPSSTLDLVQPDQTYATTKEEEWVRKKTTEVTNTKQVKTRVKRQILLQDGKVLDDSGPMVETNTTEDTEQQEHQETELRRVNDDAKTYAIDTDGKFTENLPSSYPDGVIREVKEKRVFTRKEFEESKETEDVKHYGNVTDKDFQKVVKYPKSDLRKKFLENQENIVASTGPRLINQSHKSRQVTDTEETRELSSVKPDGRIVTESQRTTEHEEFNDDELPEDQPDINDHKESHERYFKSREQEDVEYLKNGVRVGQKMRSKIENTEAERYGNGLDEPDYDTFQANTRRKLNQKGSGLKTHGLDPLLHSSSPLERKDVLTRKPLNFDQEEETRQLETSKWLENHFGSDPRSSYESLNEDDINEANCYSLRTNYFNITIKSHPTAHTKNANKIEFVPLQSLSKNSDCERKFFTINGRGEDLDEWSKRSDLYNQGRIIYPPSDQEQVLKNKQYSQPSPSHYKSSFSKYQNNSSVNYRSSPELDYSPPLSQNYHQSYSSPQKYNDDVPFPYESHNKSVQSSHYKSAYSPPMLHKKYSSTLRNESRDQKVHREPSPDYLPPNYGGDSSPSKKNLKTRFANDSVKEKSREKGSSNIIGQSIRKLVGKIRSASAERKAKQQQKAAQKQRSPSPSYQQGHVIDTNIGEGTSGKNPKTRDDFARSSSPSPVHRYYLGEDPFGGSIYGKENKYVRTPKKYKQHSNEPDKLNDNRSHSTLGRLSKSTSRLNPIQKENDRISQTLPRHSTRENRSSELKKHCDKTDSTINVSIINTISNNQHQQRLGKYLVNNKPPAKPPRTLLSRSKSLNVDLNNSTGNNMYQSNPQLNRINKCLSSLKSPGLISSLSRSQRDVRADLIGDNTEYSDYNYPKTSLHRIYRNDFNQEQKASNINGKMYEFDNISSPTSTRNYETFTSKKFHSGIYEPPTRLRKNRINFNNWREVINGKSHSNADLKETHYSTHEHDSNTKSMNTIDDFTVRTIPIERKIQSSEKRVITKSYSKHSPIPI